MSQENSYIAHFKEFDSLKEEIFKTGKIIFNRKVTTFDILCVGYLHRSFNLLEGFKLLTLENNIISAFPLIRIHLDTLLRIYASGIYDGDVQEFASRVIDGESLFKMKSKEGKNLQDGYLAKSLSKEHGFDWVKRLYDASNSFVHYSDKHIFSATQQSPLGKRQVQFSIGPENFIPQNEVLGSIHHMVNVTKGIIALLQLWNEKVLIRFEQK